MQINLGELYEKFIDDEVKTGLYNNADEVVREALKRLKEEKKKRRVEHIHELIAVGEKQIKKGKTVRYSPDLMDRITEEALNESKSGKTD